jgi:hypothetical protein
MPDRPQQKAGLGQTGTKPGNGAGRQVEPDVKTRLDGQRGWLNELDRSLKKRSLIALILTSLAIGAAAAAIYISISKNSDSERLDALETRVEALEAAAGTTTTPEVPPAEEVEPETGGEVNPQLPETDEGEGGIQPTDPLSPGDSP